MDVFKADYYLRQAIGAMVGPDMHEVTPEQVGILKLLKLAVETRSLCGPLKQRAAISTPSGNTTTRSILQS